MGAVETFRYLNISKKSDVKWDELPCDFQQLNACSTSLEPVHVLCTERAPWEGLCGKCLLVTGGSVARCK